MRMLFITVVVLVPFLLVLLASVLHQVRFEVTLVLGNQRHRQKNLRSMFASRSGA